MVLGTSWSLGVCVNQLICHNQAFVGSYNVIWITVKNGTCQNDGFPG